MDKEQAYQTLVSQIRSLVEGETDQVAIMANVAAAIHETMHFWWTGFYHVVPITGTADKHELLLGPFQGPVACMHIGYGRGVCGTAWQRAETIVVPDVEQFPGHIACSSLSRSEIVVPVFDRADASRVIAVLDIDSQYPDHFDATDQKYLEEICRNFLV
jgi:GAF domain-containing protein